MCNATLTQVTNSFTENTPVSKLLWKFVFLIRNEYKLLKRIYFLSLKKSLYSFQIKDLLEKRFQYLRGESNVSYGLYHMQAHLDAAVGMIAPGDRQAGDAVVTIAEELYAQTVVLRRELVETGEEIVQNLHQLLGAALTRQSFENIHRKSPCYYSSVQLLFQIS